MLKEDVKNYWEQGSCGTEFTDKDKFSKSYFEEIEEYRYKREPFIHQFAQFSRANGKKVLEVGIGAGSDSLQFLRSGANFTGVDLTDEAIENCKHRFSLYGFSGEFFRSDAENLPFDKDMFDLVYSWGVIHHSPNTIKALSEIYRITKPNGTIKIMLYSRYSIHTILKWLRYGLLRFKSIDWVMARYQESPGTKVYSKKEIRDIVKKFPHTDLRLYTFNQLIRSDASTSFNILRKSALVNSIMQAFGFYLCFEFKKV